MRSAKFEREGNGRAVLDKWRQTVASRSSRALECQMVMFVSSNTVSRSTIIAFGCRRRSFSSILLQELVVTRSVRVADET